MDTEAFRINQSSLPLCVLRTRTVITTCPEIPDLETPPRKRRNDGGVNGAPDVTASLR